MSLTAYIIMAVIVAVVGGYIVTSLLLFRYPQLIHKKKNLKIRPRHISHRGGAGENLENTMTAFHHAVKVGTEMLELDCQLTKDGQVVVAHDQSLKRCSGVDGLISDYNYEDLPLLKKELKLDFTPSFTTIGGEDRRIPLLREVFEEFPSIAVNVDVKTNNDELIKKVHDLIVEYKRESLTAWGNSQDAVTQKLYKMNTDIPLIFSMGKVVKLLLAFYSGMLPFLPIRESLFEVIMPSIFRGEGKDGGIQLKRSHRIILRAADILMMRPALFNHLRRRGIQTYLWVLNTEEDIEHAFKLGATGVMTDFPTLLKDYLNKHPEGSQSDISSDSQPKGYQSINSP